MNWQLRSNKIKELTRKRRLQKNTYNASCLLKVSLLIFVQGGTG